MVRTLWVALLLLAQAVQAQEADNTALRALVALNDSLAWAVEHDVTKALEHEAELERLAAQVVKGRELASALLKMGKVHAITGDRERARAYYLRSHDLFLEAGQEVNAALATIYTGMSHSDEGAYDAALKAFQEALDIYIRLGEVQFQGHAYSHMAYAKGHLGDQVGGLAYNLKALEAFEQVGDSADAAIEMSNIAESYAEMGELEKALSYDERSARLLKEAGFTVNLMGVLGSIGRTHLELGDREKAWSYFDSTYRYARSLANTDHMAIGAAGLGRVLLAQGDRSGALEKFSEAVTLFESINEVVDVVDVYCRMADVLVRQGRLDEAAPYLDKAAQLAAQLDSRVPYMTYLKSAESLDSARGELDPAYWKLKEHLSIRDSLFNRRNAHRLAGLQFGYEAEKKELIARAERERREQRQRLVRNAILAALFGSILFGVIIYRQRNRIAEARRRSDELLLNILPEEVAEELKDKGAADAKRIDQATVLFTDFKGFTAYSENLSPEQLVHDLHECFTAFDNIIARHGMEKIKTIGDAYMAAGGLPVPNETHAVDAVQAALEIRDFIAEGKARKIAAGLPYFEIRIGIHTGPVVAGIVGVKKFSYDI
ncbi:MAG: tetratricopeptide repeat protein, partial [Flavobacteriales bacterium]|nr:tetratricopeptide repeat protein [Flavobacteriales bacterium]